ncbi:unnamed protein product [Amoebophrya sp. A25]|nr:unnamed protein product [Amoebophrya sp. A25]|eukprot:GSA25T00016094001.1
MMILSSTSKNINDSNSSSWQRTAVRSSLLSELSDTESVVHLATSLVDYRYLLFTLAHVWLQCILVATYITLSCIVRTSLLSPDDRCSLTYIFLAISMLLEYLCCFVPRRGKVCPSGSI